MMTKISVKWVSKRLSQQKYWWARIYDDYRQYGRWVPTGCIDKDKAIDYMQTYPGEQFVREWLQL